MDEESLADVGDQRPESPVTNAIQAHLDEEGESEEEENDGDQERGAAVPQLNEQQTKLLRKLEGEFKGVIIENVCASRGEVLLNTLELVKQHRLPHEVHANILKLINSIFIANVVPDTRYLLDDLYKSSSGISYHFYCEVCSEILPTADFHADGTVQCVHEECNHLNSMKDLRDKNSYFVTVDIPTQLKLLLNSGDVFHTLKSPAELVRECNGIMTDLYGGQMYIAFANFVSSINNGKPVSFTMCIDGSPLFKSSGCQVWPLFLILNELPPHTRMHNLILAGFWFGDKKPNFPCFFEVFVDQMKCLSTDGCVIEIKGEATLFYCYMIACCVDSGARGAVQEVHQHNGEYGCSWCEHFGQRVGGNNNARMYPTVDPKPKLRTREELLRYGATVLAENLKHVNGVTGISFLASLPQFDIVDGMIVDPLHAKYLGVARQFAKLWFGTDGIDKWCSAQHPKGVNPPYYIGNPTNVKKINQLIQKLTPTVECRRMPRFMEDIKYFKARDWENFVLFTSVLLLKGILPEAYLNHWILYAQGSYLLQLRSLTAEDITLAEGLYDRFSSDIEVLYKNGDSETSPETPCKQKKFNVHLLQHAGQNARRWGPDWAISCYAFESGNFDMQQMIKSNKGIPNQILRHISQDISRNIMKLSSCNTPATKQFLSILGKKKVAKCVIVGKCSLLGTIRSLIPSAEEDFILRQANLNPSLFIECSKVISNHCVFTNDTYEKASRRNNSVVRLVDKSFAVIRKIVACETDNSVYAFTSVIRTTPYHSPGIAHVPIDKRFLYNIVLTEQGKQLTPFSDIDIVCVRSNVGPLGNTLSPMPNTFTIC